MKTKHILFLFALVANISLSAQTSSGSCGTNLTWTLDTGTGLLSFAGFGDMSFSGNAPWYNNRTYITTVEIPEGVTSINSNAFQNCTSLKAIEFPNSVTQIGSLALSNCTSLRKVVFGEDLTSVENSLLINCTKLDTIVWNVKNFVITSANSSLFFFISTQIKSFTFGPNVETIPDFLCCEMIGINTPIVIPESVTSIGVKAFYRCSSVHQLTLNANIKSYSNQFEGCSGLTAVNFTGTIDDWCGIAFSSSTSNPLRYARNLYINDVLATEITISDSVTAIGAYQFDNAQCLTEVILPSTITSIGIGAFRGCSNLESINLGNTIITNVNGNTFYGCSKLKAIEFPNSVTQIGSLALAGCTSLRKVVFGENIASSLSSLLNDCSQLDTVVWNVKNFNISSYYDDSPFYAVRRIIKSFTFGPHVDTIPDYICYNMSNISTTTIPKSVTSIGSNAFSGCSKLGTIYCKSSTPPQLDDVTTFENTSSSLKIYVPCGAVRAYRGSEHWSTYSSHILTAPLAAIQTSPLVEGTGQVNVPQSICDTILQAIPAYGYHFVQWNDSITVNPRVIDPAIEATYIAEFAINQYALNVSCNEVAGHIEGESGHFDHQTTHTYEAIANYGYHFTQWSDGVTDNPRTIVLTQDSNIVAEFATNQYVITATANDGAMGSVSGGGTYDYGTNVELRAIPNSGYVFSHWSNEETANPYVVTLTGDLSIEAFFEEDINALDDIHGENGSSAQKVVENYNLFILLPDGTRYDATGRKVE